MTAMDALDPAALGERLRLARTDAGKTQEQAAAAAGVARTTIVAIEKGQRPARPDEILALADLYGIAASRLLRPDAVMVDMVGRFRRAPGNHDAESEAAVRLLNQLAAASVELERMLGRPLVTDYPPERPIERGDVVQQAEEAAAALRDRLGIGLGPIADIVSLLELELGVRVFVRPLPSRISGLFAYDPTVGACMLLNAHHPRTRRALTAAHETGHFVTDRSAPDILPHGVAGEDTREERFATRFAAAFQMPAPTVRKRFRDVYDGEGRFSPRHIILMSHAFAVSPEAMCRRLEALDLVTRGTWDALVARGFSGEVVRRVLGEAGAEVPTSTFAPRLSFLAADAYQRGLVTEGQLREMLALSRVEVRELLDAMGVEPADG
jgi:Zn-dependent peptidase ImmA (M78 family)/DNA-binding XRE family transcriptional regulator